MTGELVTQGYAFIQIFLPDSEEAMKKFLLNGSSAQNGAQVPRLTGLTSDQRSRKASGRVKFEKETPSFLICLQHR